MITSIEYIQLKAFARQDGALLALLWVFTSVLYIIGMTNQMIGLAATMLICYTPFFVGGRLRNFRDYGREGLISFRRGYAYTVLVFFYAGVLFAIAMYLYLTFMDNGYLMSQMSKVLTSDEAQQAMQQYGMTEMMNESLRQMAQIRPIDYALDMLTVNITLGFILGVPISLIVMNKMDISVVIPLYNEDESIPELYAWIARVMKEHHFTYEVIFINDGSTDRSWEIISELNKQQPEVVKGIKFRRNYGKSPALYCGFEQAQGDVVITMDADLQDSPDEIPDLYRMIKEEGYDLVSGYKQKRYDPISKTIPTKLFNATARKISGIKNLHDFNCGLKAYRKAVVKNIEVYGEMHRYIPYLAKNAGFDKIGEKVVQHQARKYGSSKFMGLNRFVNGYLDLLTLWFLSTFGKKPMHVFGFLGTIMFFIGFVAAFWIGADKLWCLAHHIPQRLVTDSPYFYIALTMMMIGTQLFLTGFLGDLISRSSSGRNDYQIEETI